ncbi:Retrotransposon gag protein [Corchorus olitorius]|uniref:Retrotransposon gag protein n=1 Tax=Corchorus olitorius TaxID=93759 RepID=A0A1R3K8Z2_9ROSI|nr:Retrotransposon gag protein [Corchorus olitorius]
MLHMEGRALNWHQHFMRIKGTAPVSWIEYVLNMRSRFGSNEYFDPLSELVSLRQADDQTVDDFYDKFEPFLNLAQITDRQGLSIFVTNIKEELARAVKAEHPTDLYQAINLARHLESVYFPPKPSSAINPPYKQSSSHLMPPYTTHSRPPNRPPPLTSIPSAPPLITFPSTKQNSPTKQTSPPSKTPRIPSREERDNRRKQGLCMWCGVKYSPGHRCAINDNALDPDSPPIISLNALLGVSGPQTMRVMGRVKNQNVLILIDTGSTHNFLDSTMSKRLSCTLLPIKGVPVTVANGEDMTCKELCKALKWEVQGLCQITEVLILPLLVSTTC